MVSWASRLGPRRLLTAEVAAPAPALPPGLDVAGETCSDGAQRVLLTRRAPTVGATQSFLLVVPPPLREGP
jgi:hypothetical protein